MESAFAVMRWKLDGTHSELDVRVWLDGDSMAGLRLVLALDVGEAFAVLVEVSVHHRAQLQVGVSVWQVRHEYCCVGRVFELRLVQRHSVALEDGQQHLCSRLHVGCRCWRRRRKGRGGGDPAVPDPRLPRERGAMSLEGGGGRLRSPRALHGGGTAVFLVGMVMLRSQSGSQGGRGDAGGRETCAGEEKAKVKKEMGK